MMSFDIIRMMKCTVCLRITRNPKVICQMATLPEPQLRVCYIVPPNFPQKVALSHGRARPHLIHGTLGMPNSPSQMASQLSQLFLQNRHSLPMDRQQGHRTRNSCCASSNAATGSWTKCQLLQSLGRSTRHAASTSCGSRLSCCIQSWMLYVIRSKQVMVISHLLTAFDDICCGAKNDTLSRFWMANKGCSLLHSHSATFRSMHCSTGFFGSSLYSHSPDFWPALLTFCSHALTLRPRTCRELVSWHVSKWLLNMFWFLEH